MHPLVTDLEGEQRMTTRREYAVELGERHGQRLRRQVDGGVQRDDAAGSAVRQRAP
jgi:hypothetical protein